jgi:hypothetical protein
MESFVDQMGLRVPIWERSMSYQLVGEVMAHQGFDA